MPSIIWKGHLTFGLVSIPVKLYRAARKERVKLHYMHRASASPGFSAPEEDEEPRTAGAAAWGSYDEEPTTPSPARHPQRAQEPEAEPESEPEPPPVSRVRQTLVTNDEQPVRRSELLRG